MAVARFRVSSEAERNTNEIKEQRGKEGGRERERERERWRQANITDRQRRTKTLLASHGATGGKKGGGRGQTEAAEGRTKTEHLSCVGEERDPNSHPTLKAARAIRASSARPCPTLLSVLLAVPSHVLAKTNKKP